MKSTLGDVNADSSGSAVGVVRMDPSRSHPGVPALLKKVIDESSKEAWEQIKAKIDYTYDNLHYALQALDKETGFSKEVKSRINKGQKLFFKPNMVFPRSVDALTHGEGDGCISVTDWPFVAALMRWFHDKLGISYYQMAVGEAATAMSSTAGLYNLAYGGNGRITTEAVIEGRSGEFYGGWGFYFVRRYLAESHDPSHKDDPMRGYEDSLAANYLPPGRATDRLMVYDLNRVEAEDYRGRDIPVADGANFKEITLHKAIVGGDPGDPDDLRDYPGCVLINVPKLKVHTEEIITNAIKNIGIGLYPMEAAHDGDLNKANWKYALPHKHYPGMKGGLPHTVWYAVFDKQTGYPAKNSNGDYIIVKTAGMHGTMVDIIKAVSEQGVYMLHVSEAITTVNFDHMLTGKRVPEGYIFASIDPVALDLLAARYMFKTVPMAEARKVQEEKGFSTDFVTRVPIPTINGKGIVSENGFDAPLSRYSLFGYAESRGLGQRAYYVVGKDKWEGGKLVSVDGHLGRVEGNTFTELSTKESYYCFAKLLKDLQATMFAYIEANDKLTGSNYRQKILDFFDDDADGIISYTDSGKRGMMAVLLGLAGETQYIAGTEKHGFLRGPFVNTSQRLRGSRKDWNTEGNDLVEAYTYNAALATSFRMATGNITGQDKYFPNMSWGKGHWPSVQFAQYTSVGMSLYGAGFPHKLSLASLYGHAFQYADKTLNYGRYTGDTGIVTLPDALDKYLASVAEGAKPLPFVLYVPLGYGESAGINFPNLAETEDANLLFKANFNGGKEWWG